MKHIIYFILSFILLNACSNSGKFEIAGTIENSENKELKFSELLVNGTQEIKTLKLDKTGNFKFKSSTQIPRFYQLSLSNNNFITLLVAPGEKVNITASSNNLGNAKIKGSEGSVQVQKLNNNLVEAKKELNSIVKKIEQTDNPETIEKLNNEYAYIVDNLRDSSIAFIVSNLNSMACIVALYQKFDDENYVLYKNRDLQYIKIVSENLGKAYPESAHVKSLLADYGNLMKRYNQIKTNIELNRLMAENKVTSYPEIYLPNEQGDSVSLNSIRSKYILVNFWASWSQESIKRNLELKEVYKQYHAKGFEIYQVSLDTKLENWQRAVKFDQLPWINVIDMDGRTSYYAKIYNVKTLPTSYLINPEGEIVTINPSVEQLNSTFEYALK